MKRLLIALGLVLLGTGPTCAAQRSVFARVTVYWANGGGGSDHWTRQHRAATNIRLRSGHCAVDPRHIPYGSQVVFPDATCIAVDTGRNVVNRRAARRAGRTEAERNALVIDRFFETKEQALAWAGTHPHFMTVRVVSPNEHSKFAERSNVTPPAPLLAENSARTAFGRSTPLARSLSFLP